MTLRSYLLALLAIAGLAACTTDGETPTCPAGGDIILYDIRDAGAAKDPAIANQRAELVREGCATPAGTATGGVVIPSGGAGGTATGGQNAGGANTGGTAGRAGGGGTGG